MSLVFPYHRFPVRQPLVSLGGRRERPRPVITVTLIGPAGTRVTAGLLDTGADDTIFPERFASDIGIDLTNAPTASGAGTGLHPLTLRYASITLRIADKNEQREWSALVGFTSTPLRQPLLGYAGFLQFFTATFYGDREEAELTINALYPGT
jgi:hypothetical protein